VQQNLITSFCLSGPSKLFLGQSREKLSSHLLTTAKIALLNFKKTPIELANLQKALKMAE
jgi:hypothetical protein